MTILTSTLDSVFGTPIWTAELSPMTDQEIELIRNLPYVPVPGHRYGEPKTTKHTVETYLLQRESGLARVRDEIEKAVDYYWHNILCVVENTKIEHRHSWVTKHVTGDSNSWHQNNNALITSILYVQAPDNSGDLIFRKDANLCNLFPNIMEMQFHTYNTYTHREYYITPRNNLLVVAPAQIEHCITKNLNSQDRYALVADWWPSGITGFGIDSGYFEHPL
jgi:hypothetical protein